MERECGSWRMRGELDKFVCIVPLAVMALLLTGCSAGSGSGNSGNNITVTITNKVASVQAGAAAISFTATVQNDSTNSGVTWSLTANGASCSPACGTLSGATSAGVIYTPPSSAPASPNNQPTLTAKSVAKTSKSDSDTFTINATALSIAISNSFTSVSTAASPFVVNASVQNDPSNSGVSWTLTGSGCSANACGTLTGATATSITYNPPAAVPSPATAVLTATSVHDPTKSASDSFTIIQPAIAVSIANKIGTVPAGSGTIAFSADVENDTSNAGVIWTLTVNGIDCQTTCGTLTTTAQSTTIFYTPPSSAPAAPNNRPALRAISVADSTKSDVDTFTIGAQLSVLVTINQVKSVLAGATAGVVFDADVQNDSSGSGVTWTLTCAPSINCGSLSGNTATTVVYTPPTSAPAPPNNQATITATSVADGTASGSDTLIVTSAVSNGCNGAPSGQESLLNGSYAILLQGFENSGAGMPTLAGASFIADGQGGISGGEEDFNDSITPQHLIFDSTSGHSLYTIGADHRGCLQLTNTAGTTTVFRFALGGINSGVASRGSIIEFDDGSTDGTGSRGSGILRLQDKNSFMLSALQSQYAFGIDGWTTNGNGFVPLTAAGAFSVDNTDGALSNGVDDINVDGFLSLETPSSPRRGGSINAVSTTTGRATATFDIFHWAIYIVNSSEFFVAGMDPSETSIGRAIATGTSFTAASLSGNYILHATGNATGSADVALELLAMTPGGAQTGTLAGTVYSYGGTGAQNTTLTGVTYNIDPASGRTMLGNSSDNLPILYLTTPTDGIAGFVVGVNSDAMSGLLEPQTNQSVSAGTYIFGTEDPADNTVTNISGTTTITSGGTISGTYDQSSTSGLQAGQPINTTLTLNSAGAGNIGPNTVAVTTGGKLFLIDESGNSGAAIVVDQQ